MIFWTHVLGWTLVDFVWQGAALAVIAALGLRVLRNAPSQTRYSAACIVLALIVGSPLVTLWSLANSVTPTDAARLQPVSFAAASSVSPVAPTAAGSEHVATLLRGEVERRLPVVVSLWLVGVGFLAVRLTIGWRHVHRLHKRALAIPASRLQAAADAVAGRIGLRRLVHIVDVDQIDTPAALGWLRPVVLVPIAAVAQLTPMQVEAILAHELAHIRRHDYLINLVQSFAEVFLFYHPAVWWLSARIRLEREHCCDEIAVKACGDALLYVNALKQLEHARRPIADRTVASPLVFAATGGSLLRRVRRILRVDRDAPRSSSSAPFTIALIVVLLVIVAGRDRLNALPPKSFIPLASDTRPAFASASIKAVPVNTTNRGFLCAFGPGGRAFKAFGPADSIVACAYGIPAARIQEQLLGGPDWLSVDLFEIEAQSPSNRLPTSFAEGLPMLRTLLADRFKLIVHRETKQLDTFDLRVARRDGTLGPQMRPTPEDCAAWIASRRKGPLPSRPGYRPCGFARTSNALITNTAIPMAQFANLLSAWTGAIVRDTTGLSGYFDVDVSPMPQRASAVQERARDLALALQTQLGLTLEPSRSSVDLLIVDYAERPTTDSR
jgi:uncharacterized protein (TIGR03435 family)